MLKIEMGQIYSETTVSINLILTLVSPDITYVAKILNYGLAGSHQQGFYLNILSKIKYINNSALERIRGDERNSVFLNQ